MPVPVPFQIPRFPGLGFEPQSRQLHVFQVWGSNPSQGNSTFSRSGVRTPVKATPCFQVWGLNPSQGNFLWCNIDVFLLVNNSLSKQTILKTAEISNNISFYLCSYCIFMFNCFGFVYPAGFHFYYLFVFSFVVLKQGAIQKWRQHPILEDQTPLLPYQPLDQNGPIH